MKLCSQCLGRIGLSKEIAKELLSEIFDIDTSIIPDDIGLSNHPSWDSLSHIRIIIALEKRINRKLSTLEIIELKDIDSLASLLEINYNRT